MTEYNKVITTVNSVTQDYSFIPDQNSVIVIDTSENRIGINTFNPLFSIDVSNGTIRTQDLIVLGNFSSSTNSVTFDSDIVPQQSQTYDLGSNLPLNLQWRDLYLTRRFYLNNIDFISIAGFGNDVIAINNTNSFIDISDLDYLNIRSDVLMQGNIGIGTTNPLVSIDINRTDAIRLPVGNNSQRPTGIDGYIRYNSQTNTFEGYGSGNWGSLGGVKDVNQDTYISAELSPGINNDELIFYTNGLQRLLIGSTGNYNFNASEFNIISNHLNLNNTLFNFNIQQYNILSNHFDLSSQLIDISSNYFNLHTNFIDISSQQIDISSNFLNIRSDVLMQGNLGIGNTNPLVSIDINRTDAIRLPVGNNSQRPTGINGYIRYNSQTNTFEGYGSGNWGTLGGVKDVNQDTYISAELSPGINNDELIFYTNGLQRLLIGSTGNYNFNASEFNIISNNLNLNNTLFNFNIQQYNIISNHFDISSQLIDISSNYFNLHSKHIDLSSQQIDISSNFLNLHSNYIDLSSQQIDISSNYFNLHSNYIDLSSQQIDISSNYFNLHSKHIDLSSQQIDISSNFLNLHTNYIDISALSGYVNIQPTIKINNSYTLPSTQGNISQIIQYGINDITEWVNGPATEFNSTGLKSRHSGTNVNPINSISLGLQAGSTNQSQNAIALGYQSGNNNQKEYSISIGYQSGLNNLGQDSIAIGRLANITDNSSIILNATGSSIITDGSGLYIAPINHFITLNGLFYNPINGKITYGETISNPSISNLNMGSYKIFNISDISINNDLYVTGHTYIRNMTISGHLLPSEDGVYDIGSATKKIRDLYLTGGTLYMDNGNSGIIDVIKVTNGVATFKGTLDIPDNSNSIAYFNYIEVSGNIIGDISANTLTVNSSYKMPTTIGSANQVLTVPASGNTLTFTTPSSVWVGTATSDLNMASYNITDVNNIYANNIGLYAFGDGAFKSNGTNGNSSRSIALGYLAGETAMGTYSYALGNEAGRANMGAFSVAIGNEAGETGMGVFSVAIGNWAGKSYMGASSVAIGNWAGRDNQGNNCVAIGSNAGRDTQSAYAISIGSGAGDIKQGQDCIAIGRQAGRSDQSANTIILNATGAEYNGKHYSGLYVKPIRNALGTYGLFYDSGTGEITYNTAGGGGGGTEIINTNGLKSINASSITGNNAIALGTNANAGTETISIGVNSGSLNNYSSISIGENSGQTSVGSARIISIGYFSSNLNASSNSISIGNNAGRNYLGENSIAIGNLAADSGGNFSSCIILNSSGTSLNPSQEHQFMVKTRTDTGLTENNINVALCYNAGTGTITKSSAGYFNVSDNLFKYQEKNITNALDIINKLQPVNYVMTISNYKNDNGQVMKDHSGNIVYYNPNNSEDGKYGEYRKDWYYEAGFVAQDVNLIPELQQFVNPGDTPDKFNSLEYKRWTLSYNSLFTYNVAATQELDIIVQNLKSEVNTLKNENTLLKNALNQLLQDAGKQTIP